MGQIFCPRPGGVARSAKLSYLWPVINFFMIDEIRKQIDDLDEELIQLLAKRMDLSRQIGEEKQATGAEIHVKTREIAVLDRVKFAADQQGLSEAFVTDLYQVILAESRKTQGG
jgi:chorismate mutase-like protein